MQRLRRLCCVCVVSFSLAAFADAQSAQQTGQLEIELTGSWTTHASLGSWRSTSEALAVLHQQSHGDGDADGFTLSDLRAAFAVGRLQIVARAEQSPELTKTSASSVAIADDGNVVPFSFESRQVATMRSYDMGIALSFDVGDRGMLRPSIGATYLDGSSSFRSVCSVADGEPSWCTARAHEGHIGVALGLHASWKLGPSLVIVGDLVSRWSPGGTVTSTTFYTSSTIGGAVVPVTEETHQARSIFGGEGGVRWQASSVVGFTAGWRYRDWSYDTGAGSINGPFVRLSITM